MSLSMLVRVAFRVSVRVRVRAVITAAAQVIMPFAELLRHVGVGQQLDLAGARGGLGSGLGWG